MARPLIYWNKTAIFKASFALRIPCCVAGTFEVKFPSNHWGMLLLMLLRPRHGDVWVFSLLRWKKLRQAGYIRILETKWRWPWSGSGVSPTGQNTGHLWSHFALDSMRILLHSAGEQILAIVRFGWQQTQDVAVTETRQKSAMTCHDHKPFTGAPQHSLDIRGLFSGLLSVNVWRWKKKQIPHTKRTATSGGCLGCLSMYSLSHFQGCLTQAANRSHFSCTWWSIKSAAYSCQTYLYKVSNHG